MRGENEKYKYNHLGFTYTHWPKEEKDLFGHSIKVGSYVIWQPYSAHEGMHIGQVKSLGHDDWIEIKTAENKTITRHGYELVLVMQHQLKFKDLFEDETLY